VAFERHYVGHLVTDHLFDKRGLYPQQTAIETHDAAARKAAPEARAHAAAELNLDPADNRGSIPRRPQGGDAVGKKLPVDIHPIHSSLPQLDRLRLREDSFLPEEIVKARTHMIVAHLINSR
jgi:hypothetical protein